jgi:hypothetical protein
MTADVMKTLREHLPSADDVLRQVGLEREQPATSMASGVAVFALGAVAGAALAVFVTERASRAIRRTLRKRLHARRERGAAPTNGFADARSSTGVATSWPEGAPTPECIA